ncbi:MAG: cyclic nucleotide-binding domain-containing protein [Elusimicrobia bacterium]|nr:cyclic nucleotide-binding domain-containing protein [Elusimicrobiota bacterium]
MDKLPMGDAEYGLLARVLRKVDFFAPMTIGQMEKVLPYIMLYQYAPDENVFKQGSVGDAFYIVHQGRVAVRITKGFFSFAKTITTLGPGDFFGEMALLSSDARSATVVSLETTRLFVLLQADFQFILKENPAFHEEVKKIAARRKFASSQGGK